MKIKQTNVIEWIHWKEKQKQNEETISENHLNDSLLFFFINDIINECIFAVKTHD